MIICRSSPALAVEVQASTMNILLCPQPRIMNLKNSLRNSFEFELDRVTGRDFKFHARRKGTTLLAHSRGTRDRTTIVSCQIIIFVIKICNEVLIPILVLFNLENLEY